MDLREFIDRRWDVMKLLGTQEGTTDDLILKHLQWRYKEDVHIRENMSYKRRRNKSKEIKMKNDNSIKKLGW